MWKLWCTGWQVLHTEVQYSLAVVEQGVGDPDGEAGGSVQAVPGTVLRWAGRCMECDVGACCGDRLPGLGGRPAVACVCEQTTSFGWLSASASRHVRISSHFTFSHFPPHSQPPCNFSF